MLSWLFGSVRPAGPRVLVRGTDCSWRLLPATRCASGWVINYGGYSYLLEGGRVDGTVIFSEWKLFDGVLTFDNLPTSEKPDTLNAAATRHPEPIP
jgi:hypothetical protein